MFVRQNSIYKKLIADCYDSNRDAMTYSNKNPVICHPPCRAWGRLKYFAKPRIGEKDLALWSIDLIRTNGGVLEHPLSSSLWHEKEIPLKGGVDSFGGFCISLNQSWFGHRAEKKTIVYICGCNIKDVPRLPLNFDSIDYVISTKLRKSHPLYRKGVSKAEREETPVKFALWLIQVAELCKQKIK